MGGFIGSRIVGFSNYDSLFFGAGIVSNEMFSAIVFMVASSIIVSPVLLKSLTMMKEKSNKAVL